MSCACYVHVSMCVTCCSSVKLLCSMRSPEPSSPRSAPASPGLLFSCRAGGLAMPGGRTWDVPPGSPRLGPNSAFISSPLASRVAASRAVPKPMFAPALRKSRVIKGARPQETDIRPASDWTWLMSGPVGGGGQRFVGATGELERRTSRPISSPLNAHEARV
jgi:hypothetical protein